jgi:hypothetical protein
MMSALRTLYKIRARRDGPSSARQIVEQEFGSRVSSCELHELELMVGELVADGIVNGRRGADSITLDLRLGERVRCSVTVDRASPVALPATDSRKGSSLPLVEQLSDRWGVMPAPNGTEVWFEASCSGAR